MVRKKEKSETEPINHPLQRLFQWKFNGHKSSSSFSLNDKILVVRWMQIRGDTRFFVNRSTNTKIQRNHLTFTVFGDETNTKILLRRNDYFMPFNIRDDNLRKLQQRVIKNRGVVIDFPKRRPRKVGNWRKKRTVLHCHQPPRTNHRRNCGMNA